MMWIFQSVWRFEFSSWCISQSLETKQATSVVMIEFKKHLNTFYTYFNVLLRITIEWLAWIIQQVIFGFGRQKAQNRFWNFHENNLNVIFMLGHSLSFLHPSWYLIVIRFYNFVLQTPPTHTLDTPLPSAQVEMNLFRTQYSTFQCKMLFFKKPNYMFWLEKKCLHESGIIIPSGFFVDYISTTSKENHRK